MFGVAAAQEGLHAVARFFVGNGDDRGFLDRGMAIESGFDFAELDAVAPSLDHAVAAPEVRVVAVGSFHHDVTGLVPAAAGVVLVKRAGGLFRQRPVTLHDAAAGNAEFSLVTPRDLPSPVVDNPCLEMRAHFADGERSAPLIGNRQRHLVERADVGLGRSVQIEVFGRRQQFRQCPQMLDGKHFAGEQHQTQCRVVVAVQPSVLRQQAQYRRCGIPAGDALIRDQRREPDRILADVFGHQHQRRAMLERQMNVEDRKIEMKRRM